MNINKKELNIASEIKRHILEHRVKHASLIYLSVILVLIGFRLFGGGVGAFGCTENGDVVISSNTTWSTNQCYDDVVISGGAKLTIAGGTVHEMTTLTVGNPSGSGTIYIESNTILGVGVEIKANSIVVANNGYISADGRGYADGQGPGGSTTGGASHGAFGAGISGSQNIYGSMLQPTSLGSGGQYSSGGGAIKFSVDSSFKNDGELSADAEEFCGTTNGMGSGGSIWVDFINNSGEFSGSGYFFADGGYSYAHCTGGYGGAGGRVAITDYSSSSYTGTMRALSYGVVEKTGGAGTVVTRSNIQSVGKLKIGDRFIDDYSRVPTRLYSTDPKFDEYELSGGQIEIGSDGADFELGSGVSMAMNGFSKINIAEGRAFVLKNGSNLNMLGDRHNYNGYAWDRPPTIDIKSGSVFRAETGSILNMNSYAVVNNIFDGTFDTSGLSAITLGDLNTNHTAQNLFADNVSIQNGSVVTHPANNSTKQYWLDLNFNNLTILSGGSIDVTGKGYAAGHGPGASNTGGASYAGAGANGSSIIYGSFDSPDDLGSGGKTGSGGGLVKLNIAGSFINSGIVSSGAADKRCGAGEGTGSGGSIWVNFTNSGTISGPGGLHVRSTPQGTYEQYGCLGGGSGGRVAVTGYDPSTSVFSGNDNFWSANGGTPSLTGVTGTIVLKPNGQPKGKLIIKGNESAMPFKLLNSDPTFNEYEIDGSVIEVGVGGDFILEDSFTVKPNGTLRIASGSNFIAQSGSSFAMIGERRSAPAAANYFYYYSTFDISGNTSFIAQSGSSFAMNKYSTINNIETGVFDVSNMASLSLGGTLNTNYTASNSFPQTVSILYDGKITHPANNSTKQYWLDLNFNNLTILSGGSIDVTGKGYAGGQISSDGSGPGAGRVGGSGGGYGGSGANIGGAVGGVTYGTKYLPIDLGSGGGGAGVAGSAGGGALNLRVSGTLLVAGTIRSNGDSSSSDSGGGSGGSVTIDAGTFNCTGGTVYANGGGSNSGGAGGGGRITYKAENYTACNSMTASGANVGTVVNIPNTPISLVMQSRTTSSIIWSFTDRSFSEKSFNLYDLEGNLLATKLSTTIVQQGPIYTIEESGLSPNVSVERVVVAVNDDASSENSLEGVSNTLAAKPDLPALDYRSNSTFSIKLNPSGNSSVTQFAIFEESTGEYVQANGVLDGQPAWRTFNQWGEIDGHVVSGLLTNTQYGFKIKARSIDNIETELSEIVQKHTLASLPDGLNVGEVEPTSLRLSFNNMDNPSYTKFAIFEEISNKYVTSEGVLGDDAEWAEYTLWGGVEGNLVTNLEAGSDYLFTVRARNEDGIETDSINIEVATEEEIVEEPVEEEPEEPTTVEVQAPTLTPTAPKTGLTGDLAKILGLQPFNFMRVLMWTVSVTGVSVGLSKLLSKRKMERI